MVGRSDKDTYKILLSLVPNDFNKVIQVCFLHNCVSKHNTKCQCACMHMFKTSSVPLLSLTRMIVKVHVFSKRKV